MSHWQFKKTRKKALHDVIKTVDGKAFSLGPTSDPIADVLTVLVSKDLITPGDVVETPQGLWYYHEPDVTALPRN